jgi:hypothetical protein
MKRRGFQAFGAAAWCGESKGEHLAFNVQANPKVWASTLESCIIHLPCDFCPFHHLSHIEEVREIKILMTILS